MSTVCLKDFLNAFNELTSVHERTIIFRDWLDYTIDQFLINPNLKYFDYKKYTEEEYALFFTLFKGWIHQMREELNTNNLKWHDFLGIFYENHVKSSSKASNIGQFFTPSNVCEIMVDLIETDKIKGKFIDPAGGSGRFCLAYHVKHPEAICVCQDIDELACKMSILNFLIHGVKGSVIRGNALSGEFYEAWKVNEFPFTIMSVSSEKEAQIFIGEEV